MTAGTPGQADGRVPFHWQGIWEEFDAEVRRRWVEASDQLGLDHGMPNAAAGVAAQQPQPVPELTEQLAATKLALQETSRESSQRGARLDKALELLDEIGVMAANAPEDGDSFGLLETIAMRIAAAGVPAEPAPGLAEAPFGAEWLERTKAGP